MKQKTPYVVMKVAPDAIGGMTHFRDCPTRSEANKLVDTANGMTLTVLTRNDYEGWYQANIAPNYAA